MFIDSRHLLGPALLHKLCLYIALCTSVTAFRLTRGHQTFQRYMSSVEVGNEASAKGWNDAIDEQNAAQSARDMTGHSLMATFTGFGIKDMPCGMEFKDNFKVIYSRGVESSNPGFWRVIKFEDGREQIEATCPVLPEWMYFFDIWEGSVLWRGELDYENGRVVNGQVLTNKKKFGLFPYQETLATFEGELYTPGDSLPPMVLPSMTDQKFVPPVDFISPLDMERYPAIFDSEYRRWWFSVEDALAAGTKPPRRPRPFFVPGNGNGNKPGGSGEGKEKEEDLSRVKEGKMSRRRLQSGEKKRGGKRGF